MNKLINVIFIILFIKFINALNGGCYLELPKLSNNNQVPTINVTLSNQCTLSNCEQIINDSNNTITFQLNKGESYYFGKNYTKDENGTINYYYDGSLYFDGENLCAWFNQSSIQYSNDSDSCELLESSINCKQECISIEQSFLTSKTNSLYTSTCEDNETLPNGEIKQLVYSFSFTSKYIDQPETVSCNTNFNQISNNSGTNELILIYQYFNHTNNPNRSNYSTPVTFTITKGEPYYWDGISLVNNSYTSDKTLFYDGINLCIYYYYNYTNCIDNSIYECRSKCTVISEFSVLLEEYIQHECTNNYYTKGFSVSVKYDESGLGLNDSNKLIINNLLLLLLLSIFILNLFI